MTANTTSAVEARTFQISTDTIHNVALTSAAVVVAVVAANKARRVYCQFINNIAPGTHKKY